MANADPRLRLRAALSHRDKARLSIQECAQALAGGHMDQSRHDTLYEFYTAHLHAAEQEITAARDEQRHALEALQAKLSAALDSQFRISERATAGILTVAKANAKNRRLTADIARYRAAVAECASLIAADSPAELGGLIEAPLDQFARPDLGKPNPVSRRERAVTYLLPILMMFTAFLPWLSLEGYVRPLRDIGSLLGAAGIAPEPAPIFIQYLWLPFVLIPLMAYPLSVLRDPQNAGWGLIINGLGAISIVLVPIAALSVNPFSPVSLTELLTGLRSGAVMYLAGGAGLAVLGARRLQRRRPLESNPWPLYILLTVVLIVVAGGAAALVLAPKSPRVVFLARRANTGSGVIAVTCRNFAPTPISFHVPWPETPAPGKRPPADYGVSLFVRPQNSSAFRLVALSQECWARRGLPFPENNAFQVEPQHSLDVDLDTNRIRDMGIAARQVRLVISRGDGRTIYTFEAPVPQFRPAPPALSKPRQKPAARKQTTTPSVNKSTPRPNQQPAISVQYLGTVGSKVALSVTGPGQIRPRNLSLDVGDPIGDGWILKRLTRRPPTAVLWNERLKETVTILRGESETLAPKTAP